MPDIQKRPERTGKVNQQTANLREKDNPGHEQPQGPKGSECKPGIREPEEDDEAGNDIQIEAGKSANEPGRL